VSETSLVTRRRVLAFSAVVEIGTGLALIGAPRIVVGLLLGTDLSSDGFPLARVAGIALVALGVACWPGRQETEGGWSAVRALVAYNALVALYLAYLGVVRHLTGLLLWPAVALHAAVALLLVWRARAGAARGQAGTPANGP
jgi:hypothetical protein